MSNVLPGTLIERSFRERIILVGVVFPGLTTEMVEDELDELAQLVDSAGADVVGPGRAAPRRARPGHLRRPGQGGGDRRAQPRASTPTPSSSTTSSPRPSTATWRSCFGRTAIDRTAVILDIFAQNARSPEGKAQVELALLRYRLPRLRGPGHVAQPAGRRHRHPGSRRDPARGGPPPPGPPHAPARGRPARGRAHPARCSGAAAPAAATASWPSSATPTPASRRLLNRLTDAGVPAANRLFVTLDPRTRQLALPGGETVLVTDTVGFVRKLPHELVEAFRSTLDSVRLADLVVHVVDGTAAERRGPDGGGARGAGRDRGGRRARAGRREQGRRARPRRPRRWPTRIEGSVLHLGPHRRGDRRAAARRSATACAVRTGWSSSSCPGRAATCWPPSTARARWWARATARSRPRCRWCSTTSGRARFAEFVADAVTFRLPPYPYDRLAGLAKLAEAHAGRHGRLLHRHAVRPAAARASSRRWRRRAPSAAIPPRPAARSCARPRPPGWPGASGSATCRRRRWPPAWAPRSWWPRCRTSCGCATPERDTVLYPAVSYPTYAMGAELAGCRAVAGPAAARAARAGSTSTPSTPTTRRARCAVVQLAVEPDRRPGRPRRRGRVGTGARRPGVLRRVLRRVHLGRPAALDARSTASTAWSPCTRSPSARTWPGVRVGFYAGDPELVEFLRAVRQHAGLMVPGPAQAAGVAALADDDHVEVAAGPLPGAPRLPGRRARLTTAARSTSPRAASTCGCRCPPAAGPTRGPWPRRWPPTAGSWSARATSTARRPARARAGGRGPADGAAGAGGRAPRVG